MLGLGVGELLVVGLALVLLFGGSKIPGIARGLGESIRNFKGEMRGGAASEKLPPEKLPDAPKKLKDGESGAQRREP